MYIKNSIFSFSLLLINLSFSVIAHDLAEEQSIEKITVTSTRLNQNALTLGSNISWLDANTINQVDAKHINQTLVRIPGAWISRGNGQEHLTAIRSPVLTGAGACGAFYMAQDGISLRAPGFCNVNQLFDVNTEQAERIEILRGPGSTLYGSNAVHGVLNVITPDVFADQASTLALTLGPHDYTKGMFSLGKVKDEHGLLVYGNLTDDGGYKDDSGLEQQKINVIHQYKSGAWDIKNVLGFSNLNQDSSGFVEGFEAFKDPQLKKQNPNPEAFRDTQSFRAYSNIKYQVDETTLLSVSPYVRWASMEFLQHYLSWQPIENNSQKSIGLQVQLQKNYSTLTLLSGIDLDYTQGELSEMQPEDFSPTIPAGTHYDYDVIAKVYSPFTQLQWHASPQLSLSAGLRYEVIDYDYQNNVSDGDVCDLGVESCRFTRPADQVVDYSEWSYQFSSNYELTPENYIYANFSKGYRSPQATELFRLQAGQQVADLDSEEIISLEAGIKGQTKALFYDVTVFSMKKDNFIFQDTNRQNVSNGETSHQGMELALKYKWQQFYLSASGTLSKHEYDSNLLITSVNINGNEIDTAPEHMGSLQFGWEPMPKSFFELEWVHQGNYYLDPENTANYSGHNLLNLRAGFEVSENFSLNAEITNLTDEDYAERADYAFGSYRYFVGEPASIYVGAKVNF
jgi:outer membrane receptor protein involved in Fe transport